MVKQDDEKTHALRVNNVPDKLFVALKVKAAQEHTNVRAFVIALIEKAVGK